MRNAGESIVVRQVQSLGPPNAFHMYYSPTAYEQQTARKHKRPSIARELSVSHRGLLRRERRDSMPRGYRWGDIPTQRNDSPVADFGKVTRCTYLSHRTTRKMTRLLPNNQQRHGHAQRGIGLADHANQHHGNKGFDRYTAKQQDRHHHKHRIQLRD